MHAYACVSGRKSAPAPAAAAAAVAALDKLVVVVGVGTCVRRCWRARVWSREVSVLLIVCVLFIVANKATTQLHTHARNNLP